MSDVNPYDALDNELTDAERAALARQPMPGLAERFQANSDAAWYQNTLLGGAAGQAGRKNERDAALQHYDAMPQWETPLEAAAALAGQLWGSVRSPEALVGEVGLGARALAAAGVRTAGAGARFFAGAVDNVVLNAAADGAVQRMEMAGGDREAYDPMQTAAGAALGGLIGGAAAVGHAAVAGGLGETAGATAGKVDGATGAVVAPDATAVRAVPLAAEAETAAPSLGDVLDRQARDMRGLSRQAAATEQAPVAAPEGAAAAGEPAPLVPPDMPKGPPAAGGTGDTLASLTRGPARGQLARDQAGVAATAGDITEPPAFTRLKTVAEDLGKALQATAVRMGRVAHPKADGTFNLKSGVIRLKRPDDFDTLTHELGHHVEQHIGAPVKALMTAHAGELKPMAYEGANPKHLLEEGFAEYMRLHVTNPAYAAQAAPQFDAAFRGFMARDHGDIGAALDKAAAAWRNWLEQPSATAVASTIVTGERAKWLPKFRAEMERLGFPDTIRENLHRAYGALVDDLHPLGRAVRSLARLYRENTGRLLDLKVMDDPARLAQLSRGAFNVGHQYLMHGVTEYGTGKVVSSPLQGALVVAMGKGNALQRWDPVRLKQFGSYLWSRRALGEWERFDQGLIPNPPDKLTRGDHAQNIADLEAQFPAFAEAAPMVHDFARALWTLKRDAGLITHEQWAEGMKIRDYVPGLRAFDQEGDAAARGGKGSGTVKGGVVKRFQGSRRDVLNPLESLMADAYATAQTVARNDAVAALDRLAQAAGPGAGAIAERIPAHQMKAVTVDVLETLERAARDNGLEQADYLAMRDMVEGQLGDDAKATLFRPGVITEKGEAIVFYRHGGELRALRLADGQFGRDMMKALTDMTRAERQAFDIISLPLAKAASVARAGVVSDFAFLIKNFVRDVVQATVFYGDPLRVVGGAFKGMADEVAGRDIARAYSAYGGIMGGSNTAGLREAHGRRSLDALRRKGWAANRFTSLSGFMEGMELSETGMRLGLFKRFADEARGRGLSEHEALLEAAWQARDYIDFDRRGALVTPVARLVPFLNANLQGLDKFGRQMLVPLFREAVTAGEQRAKGEAVKAWARVSVIITATLALHAVMAEDETYTDMDPRLKGTNWVFKWNGQWVAVPKPFEVGSFLNLGPAVYDALKRHDPRWAESLLAGARQAFVPPDILTGNPVIKTATEAYTGNDLDTGNPIIPADRRGLDPALQYSARTSAFSIALGKAAGVAPVVIDQLITNFTTSLGRSALALSDWALADKPLPGWDDWVITKAFIKDASRGASSLTAFWNMVGSRTGSLEGARRSYEELMNAGDGAAATAFYNQQDEATRAWIALGPAPVAARRLHPLARAQAAVTAIRGLRTDMVDPDVVTAAGTVAVDRQARGAADDILSKLMMVEARNALVMMKAPGFEGRTVMETAGYFRELRAVSPDLARALADRYATARVVPLDAVERLWPDLRGRLLREGSAMEAGDLAAAGKAAGFEFSGAAIRRPPRHGAPASR